MTHLSAKGLSLKIDCSRPHNRGYKDGGIVVKEERMGKRNDGEEKKDQLRNYVYYLHRAEHTVEILLL